MLQKNIREGCFAKDRKKSGSSQRSSDSLAGFGERERRKREKEGKRWLAYW